MSYVIVRFVEPREVYIDDQAQGATWPRAASPRAVRRRRVHTFRLGGAADVDPPTQKLDVPERPILDPFCVAFHKC